jgi:hypothetical protein
MGTAFARPPPPTHFHICGFLDRSKRKEIVWTREQYIESKRKEIVWA